MKAKLLANWLLNHPEQEVLLQSKYGLTDVKPFIGVAKSDVKDHKTEVMLVEKGNEFVMFKKKEAGEQ